MSRVLITKSILDELADVIAAKGDEEVPLTLEEMIEIVEGLRLYEEPSLQTVTKTYTPGKTAVTDTVTPGSGYDGIEEVDVTVSAVPMAEATGTVNSAGYSTKNNQRVWKQDIRGYAESAGWVDEGLFGTSCEVEYNAVPANTAITPTESQQTVGGANYMMEGAVTIGAVPSNYVGSGIPRRDGNDLAGVYDDGEYSVNVPAGYYPYSTYLSVPNGTEGTPSASKGSVSNHSVSVTPSVTNSAGYVLGGTHTGTTVSVSASELVSGNLAISQNGNNIDVANYATVSVAVEGSGANFATATMTNSSNQNSSISFTLPSGRTPKAFFCRLTAQITRNSNSRYYYVENIRWNGSSSGGVAGRCFYMSSGQLTNITSGYSYSQSGTTFTLSSTGSRSASPGSFYNGQYELVYIY